MSFWTKMAQTIAPLIVEELANKPKIADRLAAYSKLQLDFQLFAAWLQAAFTPADKKELEKWVATLREDMKKLA